MSKLIVVWSAKGGVAKTTLTVLLASWFDSQGKKVLLADLDEQASGYGTVAKSEEMQFDAVLSVKDLDYSKYDFVVVDIPPRNGLLSKEHRRLLRTADLIVVPMLPARLDYESIVSMSKELAGKPVLRLLTKVDNRSADDKKIAATLCKGYPKMSLLDAYKKIINERHHMFNKTASKISSIAKARNEIKTISILLDR